MAELTVRPVLGSNRDPKDTFNVYVSPSYMVSREFKPGSMCSLVSSKSPLGPVIVQRSLDQNLKQNVVQVTQPLQTLYHFKLGDKVSLRNLGHDLPTATLASVLEIEETREAHASLSLNSKEKSFWNQGLTKVLAKAQMVAPGLTLPDIEIVGEIRSFKILAVDGSDDLAVYRTSANLKVEIVDSNDHDLTKQSSTLRVPTEGVGGLDDQLTKLDRVISAFNQPKTAVEWVRKAPQRKQGILLSGPPGTSGGQDFASRVEGCFPPRRS